MSGGGSVSTKEKDKEKEKEEGEGQEEIAFQTEAVYQVVKEVLEKHLEKTVYDDRKVPQLINAICEDAVKRLTALGNPYKYIVQCLVVQRTGAGVHMASSCFWDTTTDASVSVSMENESKTMCCIAAVYGAAL